jgi:hypothetical protein
MEYRGILLVSENQDGSLINQYHMRESKFLKVC